MLLCKPGVKLSNLRAQTVLGIQIAASIYAQLGIDCVITSVSNGTHRRGSLHYAGQAFDLRTKTIPRAELDHVWSRLQLALPADFDVVLEDRDGTNEHLHVEWQPKSST